jgi:hypothetical protein
MDKPLEELTPEELIEQSDLRDSAMGNHIEDCACAECKEVIRRLKDAEKYQRMKAKAEDIVKHKNDGMYGWIYLGDNAARDILAAAEKEG